MPQPFLARCHLGVTSPSPLRGQEHQIWGPRPTSSHTKHQEGLGAAQPHRTLRETQFPWVLSHFSSSSSHLVAAAHACPCPSREEGAVPGSEGTAVGWHSPPPHHVPEAQVRFCRSLKSRRGHTRGVGERCKGLIPLGTGRPPPQVLHQPIPCACETNYTRSHLISF